MDWEHWPPAPDFAHPACAHADVSLFFPERGDPVHTALKICSNCEHQLACAEWALAAPAALSGIFGGLTQRSRKLIRAERRTNPVLVPEPTGDHDGTMGDELAIESANGHVANVDEPALPEALRTCAGCSELLTGRAPSARWCSQQCRNKNRQRPELGTATRSTRPPTSPVAGTNGNGTAHPPGTSPPETPWLPIARSLLDNGYALSMMIGTTLITITRPGH